ncbi:MAG: hypothetical protein LUD18_14465 [Lachnospiraceae bacterium]|nr:hypothetical protein [Lachnospiraceae bacterium]
MNAYEVTFKKKDRYCVNVAMAESKQAVEAHYTGKYGWCAVEDCTAYKLAVARRKGCPVVTIN